MRIRATVAVVSGALALSALAIPASQAAPAKDRPGAGHLAYSKLGGHTVDPQARQRARAAATAPVISKVVVNGGAKIVVGTTAPKTVTVAITASDDSGIVDASTILWTGTTLDDDNSFGFGQNEDSATCKAAGATTSTCTLTVTVDPAFLLNSDSKSWHVGAIVLGSDGEITQNDTAGTTGLQRLSKLTVDATPEPAKKGATITIAGKLSRANWETYTYAGYTGQSVQLQFRPKTSSTYTTVKTVTTNSTGNLSTTAKATVPGYWRWNFAGTSTTPAVIAAGDGVNVT